MKVVLGYLLEVVWTGDDAAKLELIYPSLGYSCDIYTPKNPSNNKHWGSAHKAVNFRCPDSVIITLGECCAYSHGWACYLEYLSEIHGSGISGGWAQCAKQDGRLAIASRLTYRKSDWTCEPLGVVPSTSRLIVGDRRIMSWLVKNSDDGQPRLPMFQQGKQHHSVISLVFANSSVKLYPLYAGSVLFRHSIISICLASCRHGVGYIPDKNLFQLQSCTPRRIMRSPTNQFALNPKWKFKVSAGLPQRTHWIYNLINFLRSSWLVRLASLKASRLLWDIQIFKKKLFAL